MSRASDTDAGPLVAESVSYAVGCVLGRWDVRSATGGKPAPTLPDPFDPLPVCSPRPCRQGGQEARRGHRSPGGIHLRPRDFEDKLYRAATLHLDPDLNDGVVLNIAPLRELVPWKEAKSYWDDLMAASTSGRPSASNYGKSPWSVSLVQERTWDRQRYHRD